MKESSSILPKQIPQNILHLKAQIIVMAVEEGVDGFVGQGDTFGFKERLVNLLMYYAFEAGKKEREDSFNRSTNDMKEALDIIKGALDGIGWGK